ncbi:MAG TPA: hypothetical protein VM051_14445 [Usitatibacter sp.]|nr:hypothetical protein [Usitatibacter sp.]
MSQVFSRPGLRALQVPIAILIAAIAAGAGIVVGSKWYAEKERRASADSGERLQQARSRLETARRERDNLVQSAEVFRTLVERGLLQGERRLDLVELVNSLRSRHQLAALDYDIAPQRPLQLAGGRGFGSIDVLASRVKLRARALHEGDLLGFIEDLTQTPQGFYPIDKCTIRRLDAPPDSIQPRIESECTLEWITLREKRGVTRG